MPAPRNGAVRVEAPPVGLAAALAVVRRKLANRVRVTPALGHNAQIAWGFTNLTADVTDLYLERVQGDEYWRDGALVPLETRTETFRVAGGDDVTIQVRSTVHGPILSDLAGDFATVADDPFSGTTDAVVRPDELTSTGDIPPGEYAVSLRWTALDVGTTAAAIFALNEAKDFAGFRVARDS